MEFGEALGLVIGFFLIGGFLLFAVLFPLFVLWLVGKSMWFYLLFVLWLPLLAAALCIVDDF